MNNGIQIIYPRSRYEKLNQTVFEFIQNTVLEFMYLAKEPIQEKIVYTLDISHDEYQYDNYLSYVFYISSYTGGAHSKHDIYSIVYNVSNNKIVSLKNLIEKEENILNILSNQSRVILENNAKITNKDMLLMGTKPEIDNFKVFAFGPAGMIFYFPEYQVAPYSSGAFKIVIPYSIIFNKEKDSN